MKKKAGGKELFAESVVPLHWNWGMHWALPPPPPHLGSVSSCLPKATRLYSDTDFVVLPPARVPLGWRWAMIALGFIYSIYWREYLGYYSFTSLESWVIERHPILLNHKDHTWLCYKHWQFRGHYKALTGEPQPFTWSALLWGKKALQEKKNVVINFMGLQSKRDSWIRSHMTANAPRPLHLHGLHNACYTTCPLQLIICIYF